ncbi:Uncharacterised protein [Vibrio cholerae]|nr:Uncharacterised protein [Vibrio cholerae]
MTGQVGNSENCSVKYSGRIKCACSASNKPDKINSSQNGEER